MLQYPIAEEYMLGSLNKAKRINIILKNKNQISIPRKMNSISEEIKNPVFILETGSKTGSDKLPAELEKLYLSF